MSDSPKSIKSDTVACTLAVGPKVSVILPTHNRARLLIRSLESVLSQSFNDIEVIVIENACSDATAELLDRVSDPRIRRLRLESKCGASAARNAGIAIARASIIAFQDDDDIWLPEKLSRQWEALAAAPIGTGLCLCGYIRLTPRGAEALYERKYFQELDFHCGFGVRDYSVVATPGWLIHRGYLDRAGHFDEQLPARNDWELALRLRNICEFTYVEGPLFIQDQRHVTSMMGNEAAFSAALKRIEIVHGHCWSGHKDIIAGHAAIIGRYEVGDGDIVSGRKWLWKSIRLVPWQPKLLLLLLVSFLGSKPVRSARAFKRRGQRILR
jgi:glycosyltransferase involved in cell wall biosynthesis